jgi:hypothetical protein
MVPVASHSGRTSTSSHTLVMAAAASFLLPHNHAWTCRITGHVATTIIVAQIMAPRKGRSTHTVSTSRVTMNSTPSVARARSIRGATTCVSLMLWAPADQLL